MKRFLTVPNYILVLVTLVTFAAIYSLISPAPSIVEQYPDGVCTFEDGKCPQLTDYITSEHNAQVKCKTLLSVNIDKKGFITVNYSIGEDYYTQDYLTVQEFYGMFGFHLSNTNTH